MKKVTWSWARLAETLSQIETLCHERQQEAFESLNFEDSRRWIARRISFAEAAERARQLAKEEEEKSTIDT